MKKIELTKGRSAIVDDDDFDKLNQFKWHCHPAGYATRNVRGQNGRQQKVLMHRLILNPAKGQFIDHVNGDRLDNRKQNLRLATHRENLRNVGSQGRGTSLYKGVHWNKQCRRWRAEIKGPQGQCVMGTYCDELQAAHAYDTACVLMHGRFARPNFIGPMYDEPVTMPKEQIRLLAQMVEYTVTQVPAFK